MEHTESARTSVATLVDHATGEIIVSSGLAIPEPGQLVPAGFAEQVRDDLKLIHDPGLVEEYRRRLAALEHYVRGKEAKNEAQAASRWAEVRIGELAGPAERGGDHGNQYTGGKLNAFNLPLTPEERVWFRKLAAHVPIVEGCISGELTNGTAKTSRAAILAEIEKRQIDENPPTLPDGTYRAIVIDPPWPMGKIERHERPNQDEVLDYPTMTLEQIQALPIGDLAAEDGAHLYLWVTHKFLPAGLDMVEAWGFRYQCLMTWRKNVGITPFSWMYDTEHVIFARRGSLDLDELGLRLSFDAPVTRHSAKPDVFYERVMRATPGPRIELFARQPRDGFVVWGNEVAHVG